MNIKIRKANINDFFSVSNLVMEVHKLHLQNRPDVYLNIDNIYTIKEFEDILNSNDTYIFVVEDKDTQCIAAYSLIQILETKNPIYIPRKFAYIDDFCVSSKYKRKGIGTLLFNHITKYAKEKNVSSIQLNVWEFNKDAMKFYESLGMTTRNRRMELNL